MKNRHATALHILQAAQELFFQKGYEKATTREISEMAGVSNAAVYHYFKNKEEILFEICVYAADELIENMRKAIARNISSASTVKEQITDIMLEYARTYLKNVSFNKILLHEIEFLSDEKKRIILDKETQNIHQLRLFLQSLIQNGMLKPFNPTVMTFSLISQLHWLYFWFRPEKGLNLQEVIGQIADMYLNGVVKPNAGGEQCS